MKKSTLKKIIAVYSNLPSGGANVLRELTNKFLGKNFKTIQILEPEYKISNVFKYLYTSLILSPIIQRRLVKNLHFDLLIVHHSWLVKNPNILRYTNQPKLYFCHDVLREYYDLDHIYQQSFKDRIINIIRLPIKWLNFINVRAKNITIIANSNYSKKIIDKSYGVNSIVVYPGIITKKYYPQANLKKKNQVIMISSINKIKRQHFLVEVISKIHKSLRPDLVLVGNGYNDQYLKYIVNNARKLKVNLIIKINISDIEKRLIMHESKAFLYAPVSEPFGLVIEEAIAAGLPVVAYKKGGGYAELITNNNGQIINNLDALDWSKQLARLISDEKRMRKIMRYNLKFAAEKLDVKYMYAQIIKLINKIL